MSIVNWITLFLLALVFFSLPSAGAAEPNYAGAKACAGCHPEEFRAQSASSHALALAHSSAGQPGDWAFGAGDQAITFVSRVDAEHYREEGQSWYRKLNGYGRTPGATSAAGRIYRVFDPSGAILRCFSCHSTGSLQLGADESIEPHELGVRCEVCHGPAAEHVRAPTEVRLENPKHLSAERINDFCGECHRMPLGANETVDYRDPWNVRHQPPLLAASACFRQSQGKLNCFTCHSPHAPLERRLPAYDAACKTCHTSPVHKRAVAGRPCAGCHMPRVPATANLSFANHRIAIYSPSDPLIPAGAAR